MERALVKVSAFLTEQITSARNIGDERSYDIQTLGNADYERSYEMERALVRDRFGENSLKF